MNKLLFRFSLLFIINLLFHSCATKAVSTNFNNYNTNGNGLLIGTITFPKNRQWFDKYYFRLKDIESNMYIDFTIESFENVNEPAPDNNYTKKYVFILEKKPGKYLINNFHGYAKDDENHMIYTGNVSDFSIPVSIDKGEITYIGDIFCGENIIEKKISFNVTDKYEHDIRYFKSKNSKVDWTKVTKSIRQP